jgi:DNA-binding transcriptional LysR family regulator
MLTQSAIGDLEFTLLRTFLAVVENGSLCKTAAVVDRTQPAISQQMKRLENIVGHKLLSRGRAGTTLTRHGEMLVPYAKRALDLNDEMLERLRGESPGVRVALGVSTDVALMGLSSAMKRFQSLHQDLELKLIVSAAARLNALLKSKKLDLVVGDPEVITGIPVVTWSVPMAWAAQKDLQVDRSRTMPLVLFERPFPWQDAILQDLQKAGLEWRVAFESSSMDAILAATRSGLGIALLPAEAVRNYKLAVVKNPALPTPASIRLGMYRSASLATGARTMLEIALADLFKSGAGS